MGTPRVSLHGIRKSFGSTLALTAVELEAGAGEVHAVLGENGAGKSTLMNLLVGVFAPDAGAILLDGLPWRPRGPADARARGLAMVHQELALCPHLDVAANVMLGIEPAVGGVLQRRSADRLVHEALARAFGSRAVDLRRPISELALADRQLVEIARALATAKASGGALRLLMLDEPTSSLSATDAERLVSLVRDLAGQGTTVLYVTHLLEEIGRIADRFTVLRDGKTVASGAVGSMPLASIVERMAGRGCRTLERSERADPNDDVAVAYPRSARTAGEVIIDGRGLAGARLPVDASFQLRRGEILGISGLIGSGRTELLRAVFGLDPVRKGELRVGAAFGPASPARRLAQGVGMASEDRKGEGLALSLSISANLTLSSLGPSGIGLASRTRKAAARWIAELGIKCRDPDQPVRELSGGNQQKVQLARLLHHDVDVLLLDEPMRGIDVASKAEVARICDAAASRGKAVMLVSSFVPELLGMCDRIAVMNRGRLGPARPAGDCDAAGLLGEAIAE